MKYITHKLLNFLNSKNVPYLSIRELKDIKILERKNQMSRNFRKYVQDLNKKQTEWIKNNY
tara:strand:- start:983 stop:1165 length:183 start_codon:yes stop_codon:yes gene_type:complete